MATYTTQIRAAAIQLTVNTGTINSKTFTATVGEDGFTLNFKLGTADITNKSSGGATERTYTFSDWGGSMNGRLVTTDTIAKRILTDMQTTPAVTWVKATPTGFSRIFAGPAYFTDLTFNFPKDNTIDWSGTFTAAGAMSTKTA